VGAERGCSRVYRSVRVAEAASREDPVRAARALNTCAGCGLRWVQNKSQRKKPTMKSAAVSSRVDAVLANLRKAGADMPGV
jgi:hypothetical protein